MVKVVGFQTLDQDSQLVAVENVASESTGVAGVIGELQQEVNLMVNCQRNILHNYHFDFFL